jgi:hypothetical protein
MRLLLRIIKNKLFNDNAKPLGRWKLDYCSKKMNRKIDMSNEDHCGPCGQYIVTKMQHDRFITQKSLNKFN